MKGNEKNNKKDIKQYFSNFSKLNLKWNIQKYIEIKTKIIAIMLYALFVESIEKRKRLSNIFTILLQQSLKVSLTPLSTNDEHINKVNANKNTIILFVVSGILMK